MSKKLIMIDGNSLVFRAFHALPPMKKRNPLASTPLQIAEAIAQKHMPGALVEELEGISPQTAEQLLAKYFSNPQRNV